MILICGNGHVTPENIVLGRKNYSDKCGVVLSYDRITGAKYCQCKLNELEIVLDQYEEYLYARRISPNDKRLENWILLDTHSLKGLIPVREKIRDLLLSNHEVYTGYLCTSIRDVRDSVILYRKR